MESLAFLKSNDTLSFVKRNTNTCTTFLQHSGYLNNFQMILLSVFNAVTMVGNLLANLTVILCLIKTEQIKNMSCNGFPVKSFKCACCNDHSAFGSG